LIVSLSGLRGGDAGESVLRRRDAGESVLRRRDSGESVLRRRVAKNRACQESEIVSS
jgi:hypothetical protein